MKLKITILVLAIYLTGCATANLSPEGANVRITKTEPTGCDLVGDVYGQGDGGPFAKISSNMEYARNAIRNEAAKKGANTVSLDSSANTNGIINISGQAFKCP